MTDTTDVGEIDFDLWPDHCWKCDVREAETDLGLCKRCDRDMQRDSPPPPARRGRLTS